jgi:hypothetical protein
MREVLEDILADYKRGVGVPALQKTPESILKLFLKECRKNGLHIGYLLLVSKVDYW